MWKVRREKRARPSMNLKIQGIIIEAEGQKRDNDDAIRAWDRISDGVLHNEDPLEV